MNTNKKLEILVLGSNFAGLQTARHLREYIKDTANITVVEKKSYLLFIPNIPMEILEGKDPTADLQLPLAPIYKEDGTRFIQAEVKEIDVYKKEVKILPTERPGSALEKLRYDYLIIALGNRLAFDKIEGFAEYGHTVTDTYQGNKLRYYIENEYKGGPIVVGSAKFNQGDPKKLPFDIPVAKAACEGPPVEVSLSLAYRLQQLGKGGPRNITLFTPAELIAEDAGEEIVKQLLEIAGNMGFGYKNKVEDIKRITKDGIEFTNGESLEAEVKIIFPNWEPHDFMKGLPISDDKGFVIHGLDMRNPDFPEVFTVGDAAAGTVPKLGTIGHIQSYIVAKQIAKDLRCIPSEEADKETFKPVVVCYGDMGGGKAFYIHSDVWYGGNTQILKMGRIYYDIKVAFKHLYFQAGGKLSHWQWKLGMWLTDTF